MNANVERLALRARSRLMAHRPTPRPPLAARLTGWARAGSAWRWLASGPAVVLVTVVKGVWWVSAQVAGVAAILAGWSPPLTLATLATLPPCPEPTPPAPSTPEPRPAVDEDGDPAEWNFNHDPWVRLQREQLAVQREHLAELRLRREARAAELATNRPTAPQHHQTPAARPVPSQWWTPPTTRRRLRVGHALVIVALVAGLAWGIGAFSLGIASSAGWIRQPPSFSQLEQPTGATP